MASKSVKVKSDNKQKMDAHQKKMRTMQIIFLAISVLIILSMALSSLVAF